MILREIYDTFYIEIPQKLEWFEKYQNEDQEIQKLIERYLCQLKEDYEFF